MDLDLTLDLNAEETPVGTPPVITTGLLDDATWGTAYTFQLVATGTVTSWSLQSGTLPTGVTLNTATGEISGTPQQAGTFDNLAFVAHGPGGASAPSDLALGVNALTLNYDFKNDLQGWLDCGVGTTTDVSGTVREEGTGGSGIWSPDTIPSYWSSANVTVKGKVDAVSNCDLFVAIGRASGAGTLAPNGTNHTGLPPAVDDCLSADVTGSGAADKIYHTASGGATSTEFSGSVINASTTTLTSFRVLFTKSGNDLRIRVYYNSNVIADMDETVTNAALAAGSIKIGLLSWEGGGKGVNWDDFSAVIS